MKMRSFFEYIYRAAHNNNKEMALADITHFLGELLIVLAFTKASVAFPSLYAGYKPLCLPSKDKGVMASKIPLRIDTRKDFQLGSKSTCLTKSRFTEEARMEKENIFRKQLFQGPSNKQIA
uniref:Uncharacterized protein n=1 Tax=Glossina austeni TaxID=7395 RepID=A0A1A9VTR0_GLOAU